MPTSNMENTNSKEFLGKVRDEILDNLKHIKPVSSMNGAEGINLPAHLTMDMSNLRQAEEDSHPDKRPSKQMN